MLLAMHGLAHLNALRAFEAVARHGGYIAAARELNVTPAAVGQQVRILEAWLGLTLFERGKTGPVRLSPTVAARAVMPELRDAFARLGRVVERLREERGTGVLTVTTTAALISKWLLPRLGDFTSTHPGIELRLDVADRVVELGPGRADLAIRYGTGPWPGLVATRLLAEEVFPVCSPAVAVGAPALHVPADLAGLMLIHDLTAGAEGGGFPSWRDWLTQAGVDVAAADRGLRINASAAVIQAAIAGQGVALGRSVLVAGDLAAGLLVRPFASPSIRLHRSWQIVHRPEAASEPKLLAFKDWLFAQAA